MRKLTTEEFVKRANEIYSHKYGYDKCVYIHSLDYVIVTCPKHGDFKIKASNHINNKQGCPRCSKESASLKLRTSYDNLMEDIKKLNVDFDFSLIPKDFKNKRQKVDVICKKHGKFSCQIRDIFRSKFCGCKCCRVEADRHDIDIFKEKSASQHGDKYDYSKTIYKTAHDPVIVTCPDHGDFIVKPYTHVSGKGFCPKCTSFVSSMEIDCIDFLKENEIKIDSSVRSIKNIQEIDIFHHERKLGLEFNGLYWHSDIFKEKRYHINKTIEMNKNGYNLIHIFEDEWAYKKEICKSRLLNFFGLNEKIYGRLCQIIELDNKTCKKFLEKNHIQGYCVSKIRYGLKYKGELVAVSTFGKKRINLGNRNINEDDYELLRYCSKIGTNVLGGAGKLLKKFEKDYHPKFLISYCDIRWGNGKLYENLGFSLEKITEPNYFYVKGGKRFNRFKFRKDKLVSSGHDKLKTEKQIMEEMGYRRIYDCGHKKFIKKYNNYV